MKLIFGTDPLCGWCYGIGPAIKRVIADHSDLEIVPVLGGLVTGARVGPYGEMEGYIRGASTRLEAVTGRSPSEVFYQMIKCDGVVGNSGPPSVAIGAMRAAHPAHVLDFILQVTDDHFGKGCDLNDPQTYLSIADQMGLELALPDLNDLGLAQSEWKHGQSLGLTSFPSLWVAHEDKIMPLPVNYDPDGLSRDVSVAIKSVQNQ